MKKFGKYLLTLTLAAIASLGFACGSSGSWRGSSVKDSSAVAKESLGGFSAATEDYVYFINGIGSYSDDNTFGVPVKGALAAVKKSEIDSAKSEITVPEIFTAQSYTSGLYIANESGVNYVYYGTANRDKTATGATAYTEMTFTKAAVDGSSVTKLFSVSSHSAEYRIAEKNGVVYIVYYDETAKALKSFNCSDKTTKTIAVTDDTTNEQVNGEYISLDTYTFLDTGSDITVVYTAKVFTEKYYADKAAKEGYSRETANYNYLYAYSVGEDAAVKLNGKTEGLTFAVKAVNGEYLFYTQTDINGNAKTFGVQAFDFENAKEINSADNVKTNMIINSFEEIYYFDTDAIVKTTLIGNEFSVKETVAKVSGVSELYFMQGNDLYYRNSDSYLVRITLGEQAEANPIKVSIGTVSSSWYAPELISANGKTYVLYCDNTISGAEYIGFTDINGEVIEDDDGDYIGGAATLSVLTDADAATVLESKINGISSPLELKEEDGALYSETVKEVRATFDAATDTVKGLVSDTAKEKLENAEEGVALANLFVKLEGAKKGFSNMTDEEKEAFKTAAKTDFDAANSKVEELTAVSVDYVKAVRAYVENNYNYYYQEAVKIFTEVKTEA